MTGLSPPIAASSTRPATAGARLFVRLEQAQPLQRGDGPDLSREVATAAANDLRDAAPALCNKRHDLLNARARGPDDADRAARHNIDEAKAHAVEHGGAAVWPHQQQAALLRKLFERDFVGERHVIAEEEDVQPGAQSAFAFQRGIRAGYGDDGYPRLSRLHAPRRLFQRARLLHP